MSKGRLEAFSDGVIAIAVTLLVLDIHVPEPGREGLGRALTGYWPSYAAYVVSFLTIGIIWINHHATVARLRRVDHGVLILNLLLLMTIAVLPFTTALMAAYLRHPEGQHLAAAIYAGSFLLLGCAFFSLHAYLMLRRPELLSDGVNRAARLAILRRNGAGLLPYAAATALSLVSSYLTLGICAAVAVYYAIPGGGEPAAGEGGRANVSVEPATRASLLEEFPVTPLRARYVSELRRGCSSP